MKIEKITDSGSPYKFDTLWDGVPVFTDKNIELINTLINNDSNYRLSFDDNDRSGKFSAGFLKGRFPQGYEDIHKTVELIDKENATHISVTGIKEGSGGGRKIVSEYILKNYDDIRRQIAAGKSDVVIKLAEEPVDGRLNISFASKFCAYTNRYCFGRDDYSIVDKVMCRVLPAYEAIYLGETSIDRRKWLRQQEKKNFDYKTYQNTIKAILDCINKSQYVSGKVGRRDFDLFLWYYYKGSDDRINKLYEEVSKHL